MADLVATRRTTLSPEDVVVRGVQYFSTGKWRATSQSGRSATFQGMPPIPWGLMLLVILGFMACVVPGIVLYFMLIKKLRQFQNLVVTANPIEGGTEVVVTHPDWTAGLVSKFMENLPPMEA